MFSKSVDVPGSPSCVGSSCQRKTFVGVPLATPHQTTSIDVIVVTAPTLPKRESQTMSPPAPQPSRFSVLPSS